VLYNRSISEKEIALIEVVERQKSMINTLFNEGRSESEILQFLNNTREKYYGIGQKGEFVISHQIGDSVIFVFATSKQTNFNINDPKRRGLPTYLSLRGKTGSIIIKGYNGIKVMAAYTYIPSLKWGLAARVPIEEINRPYYIAMGLTICISFLLISFCVLLFVYISNPIVKAIFKSEKLYRELFENMLNGFSYCKILYNQEEYTDFIYLSVNKAFESLTGLKNVVGKKVTEVLPGIQNSDKELLEMFARVAKTGNPEVFERYMEVLQMWLNISVYSPEKEYFIVVFDVITERKMAEFRLKEKNDEIESQNEELNHTIEELNQTNSELILARERAEHSDRLKTAFLQNVSHEIRTPMNAIMGFSNLLADNFNDKRKLTSFSKIINQRCDDLLSIIDEILDISKIESGHAPVSMEECNLVSLFSEITLFFSEYKKNQNKDHIEFNLQVQCGTGDSMIFTDKVKLKQILVNLIGNAFKFTHQGYIHAGCKLDANNLLLFFVSDTGIGIPLNKFDYVFERFAQLESTPGYLYGGTGLGLPIVKGLIELLNGKIWIESEVNKGSTFYFSFPYEVINKFHDENKTVQEPDKDYDFLNKTILIVEDDVYNAEYLKEIISGLGLEILHTLYGNEAIQITQTKKTDLILMDIRLTDTDGYTVTKKIKKTNPEIKIIAQTAYATADDKIRAINAGCNDYISKPIKREYLLPLLKKHLSNSEHTNAPIPSL
jgi:signal transduction histidine kinase/ActR/RegA family two-component response regulator